jgi:Na+-transporting NADH:ubiquinone oxidoreductase subunit NqrD
MEVDPLAVTARVDVACPLGLSVTLVGLRDAASPCLRAGVTDSERMIVPANPLTLVTMMVEVLEVSVFMVIAEGLAEIVKLGGGGPKFAP